MQGTMEQHVTIFSALINDRFSEISDIVIYPEGDSITRAENYVKANELFNTLSDKELYELVYDVGLLPLVFLLPGVDEIHAQLLNGFDFSGYVRYIDTAITDLTNIKTLPEFYSDILSKSEKKTKNNVVIYLLDKLINSTDSDYVDVLADYYQMVDN